jgi:hypothetical protein
MAYDDGSVHVVFDDAKTGETRRVRSELSEGVEGGGREVRHGRDVWEARGSGAAAIGRRDDQYAHCDRVISPTWTMVVFGDTPLFEPFAMIPSCFSI